MNDSIHIEQGVSPNILTFGVSGINLFGELDYQDNVSSVKRDSSSLSGYTSGYVPQSNLSISVPRSIVTYIDLHLSKKIALNFNYRMFDYSYFNGASTVKVSEKTVGFIPRFESRIFSIYFPCIMPLELDRNPEVGAAIAIGPISFRLDNILPYVYNSDSRSGIHAGISIPLHHRSLSDKDGDEVSDRFDICNGETGNWFTQGCPDMDGDTVPDYKDSCVSEFGLKFFNGCPDVDGDSIIDKYDDCLNVFGVDYFNGCPDRDGDSTRDELDLCPDKYGPKEDSGCPDSDGDGFHDVEDACPDIFGIPENNGCLAVDTDQDGVYDHLDKCPKTPGRPENKGCPILDETKFSADLSDLTQNFRWNYNESTLEEGSYDIIEELVLFLDQHSELGVTIVVLPENKDSSSLILANQRVESLLSLVNGEYDIEEGRLIIKRSESNFYESKYTEFEILKLENQE